MVLLNRPKKKLAKSQKVFIVACLAGAFFLFGLIFVSPLAALAQTGAEQAGLTAGTGFGEVNLGTRDIKSTVAMIINIVLGVLGIIAVALILYAGFLWMTASGNEEQVAKAKSIMRNAVIGLVIIMASWGIASFIISRLSSASTQSNTTDDGTGGGTGGGLGGEQFSLQEFQTSHAGATSRDDVYLCSNIQSKFNHWLDLQSVAPARAAKKLTVFQTSDKKIDGEYEPFPEPKQLGLDVKTMSNIVAFGLDRAKTEDAFIDEWPINSQFEIRVSKSLQDTSGDSLKDCAALGCNDRTDYFAWIFDTTDKRDVVKPSLSSAYPRLPGDIEGYPDRDVNRSITFTLNFSEEIDFFSALDAQGKLNPANIKIEQIESDKNQAIKETIPAEHFDVSASNTGLQFVLNKTHQSSLNDGPYLEPYSWYRITVQNLTDLCGNPLNNGPVVWIFQTNGNIPGVAFVYPADKYQYACPATETFVQFRTSMYDIKNQSCVVAPTARGLVTSGTGVDGRNLLVSDNVPVQSAGGAPVNPNNFCKRYDFAPSSQALSVDKDYKPEVSYRNPANDAQTAKTNWSFTVKPADQCANAPYISALSPSTGPWGRCLTIQGGYFANTPGGDGHDTNRNNSDAQVKLNLKSGRNKLPLGEIGDAIRAHWTQDPSFKDGLALDVADANWHNTYITDEMPNIPNKEVSEIKLVPPGEGDKPIIDFNFFVVRNAMLGGTMTPLTSNLAAFAVPIKDSAYQGPCLYTISPNVGPIATPVTFTGTRLGTLPSSNYDPRFGVLFTNNKEAIIATPQDLNWTSTLIKTTVPTGSSDGDVKVKTPQGLSNGLPFDVASGVGGPCATSNDCRDGLICQNKICTEPPRVTGFRIEQTWPTSGCNSACTNAEKSFVTNMVIKPASAIVATFTGEARQSGALDIRECLSDNCNSLSAHQSFTPRIVDKKLFFDGFTLASGKRYRVIVYGGANGLVSNTGNKELVDLNYDADANGSKDSYSWYFKVGDSDCAVDRVDTVPSSLTLEEGASGTVNGDAYSKPDSCSAQGQVLDVDENAWSWKKCKYGVGNIKQECSTCVVPTVGDGDVFTFNNLTEKASKGISATIGAGSPAGKNGLACLFYGNTGAINDGTIVIVRSKCETDAQCNLSNDSDAANDCPGSTCNLEGSNAGRCTPVINNFSPESGAPGTWVTLNGCYFGNQRGEVKMGETVFLEPGGNCGENTWSDNQIIAEAPAGITGSGKLKVTENRRQDAQSTTTVSDFKIDEKVHPGLCRVEDNYGAAKKEVNLFGKNFGATQTSQADEVRFKDAGARVIGWRDDLLKVAVPQLNLTVEALKAAVTVWKTANSSNPKDFNVIKSAPGPDRGMPLDLKVESYQPGVSKKACLNMVEEVTLDGILDGSSLKLGQVSSTTQSNFIVKKTGPNNSLAGEVWLDYPANNKTKISFIPSEPFSLTTNYQIIIKSGNEGLLSTTGGHLIAGTAGTPCSQIIGDKCVINFQTIGNSPVEKANCAVKDLGVVPTNPYFTCANDNCEGDFQPTVAGHQRLFRVRPQAKNGQPIYIPGAIFNWTSSDANIITLQDPAKTERMATTTIGKKDGKSRVEVVLNGTGGGDPTKAIKGASDVTVFLCANPWPALPTNGIFAPYQDSSAPVTNFSTYYCRDRGTSGIDDDLPSFGLIATSTNRMGVPELVKELFFTEATSTDAIGIRILANFEHYSTSEWYNRQTFNKGAPSPLIIDGYDGLRDGRTVYVSAPNESAIGSLYTNVYLLSYSDGANSDTVNIINQMVKNMSFAANITNPINKDKLRRDVKRWSDALILAGALIGETAPIKLPAGTFIASTSVSVWPSWQETLGKELGGRLPIDPINKLMCPADYDQKTCFDKNKKAPKPKFICQNGSQAYFYKYGTTANSSTLGFNLEYADDPSRWNGLTDPWFSVTPTESWCANLEYRQIY